MKMTSTEWVDMYVALTAEDILAEDTHPNFRASLPRKLQAPGLQTDTHSSQWHAIQGGAMEQC